MFWSETVFSVRVALHIANIRMSSHCVEELVPNIRVHVRVSLGVPFSRLASSAAITILSRALRIKYIRHDATSLENRYTTSPSIGHSS